MKRREMSSRVLNGLLGDRMTKLWCMIHSHFLVSFEAASFLDNAATTVMHGFVARLTRLQAASTCAF